MLNEAKQIIQFQLSFDSRCPKQGDKLVLKMNEGFNPLCMLENRENQQEDRLLKQIIKLDKVALRTSAIKRRERWIRMRKLYCKPRKWWSEHKS